ncbi:MAG: hypothetical protein HOV79_08440 [Hamadaea sp.]|nr:hypothetical protein [Hamadaea sp.]
MTTTAAPSVYQVRCTPFSLRGLQALGITALVAGSTLGFQEGEPVVAVAGILFFGFGAVVWWYPLVTRLVQLRADERGLALGGGEALPWAEMAVVEVERHRFHKTVAVTLGHWIEIGPDEVDEDDYPEPGVYLVNTGGGAVSSDGWHLRERRFWPLVSHYAPHLIEEGPKSGRRTNEPPAGSHDRGGNPAVITPQNPPRS